MVKISTNIKNFIETITKGLFYTKTETDTKLNNKANTNHSHTSRDIEIALENDDGLLVDEYGADTQAFVNCLIYDHEKRLEDIDVGANKTVVDSNLSSTSTNPVQNKVINNALNGKADSNHKHNDVLPLKQVDSMYPNLPVWFMVKNGWCIVQWENPILYLADKGVDVPTYGWFTIGNVPIPQTGNMIYHQLTDNGMDYCIRVTDEGLIESNVPDYQMNLYGTLVYPTELTTNPV